jgi:hypothetical protein
MNSSNVFIRTARPLTQNLCALNNKYSSFLKEARERKSLKRPDSIGEVLVSGKGDGSDAISEVGQTTKDCPDE